MLDIRIASLKSGLHTFTFEPSPEEIGLDPAEFKGISVAVRLDLEPDQAYVTLTARAVASLVCDRTVVTFEQPVEGTHAILFTAAEMGEEVTDEVQPLPPDTVSLDLTEAVRDTLLLALPSRRVAPGAEEAPLPTTFGALRDENGDVIDPRWEALRKFKDPS